MTMTIRGSRVGRAPELRSSTCGIKLTVAAKSACNLSSCRGSESASSLRLQSADATVTGLGLLLTVPHHTVSPARWHHRVRS